MGGMNGQSNQQAAPNNIQKECTDVGAAIGEAMGDVEALRSLIRELGSSSHTVPIIERIKALEDRITTRYRGLAKQMTRIKSNPESADRRNQKKVQMTGERLWTAEQDHQRAGAEFRVMLDELKRRDVRNAYPQASDMEVEEMVANPSLSNVFQQAVSLGLNSIKSTANVSAGHAN